MKAMYSRCPKKVGAIHIHTNLVSLIYLSIAFVRMLYISCICHTHNESIFMMHSCLSLASEQCFSKKTNIPIPGIGAFCIQIYDIIQLPINSFLSSFIHMQESWILSKKYHDFGAFGAKIILFYNCQLMPCYLIQMQESMNLLKKML